MTTRLGASRGLCGTRRPTPTCHTDLEQTMTHEQAAYRRHPLDAEAPTVADQQAELRDRIADTLREHYLCTNRDEADADGNLPCRCGDWREPGAEADDENDWDSHLADAALAVLPPPAPCSCRTNPTLTAQIGYPVRCPHCPPDAGPVPPTHWTKHVQRHHPEAARVLPPAADRAAEAPAAECSAQNRNYESGPRLCIRAAQHTGDHIDERGFHWSDTVAVYPLADGTFRAGVNRAVLRRLAAEAQQQESGSGCAHCVCCHAWGDREAHAALVRDDGVEAQQQPETDRAVLDHIREIARRLTAHAVGFQDVLDDSDRDPWARTVGADIAELNAALTSAQQQPETGPRPARGDQFEAWLKTQRDAAADYPEAYHAADGLLDLYRLHADTGTPLDEHACEGRAVGDCEHLERPTEARQLLCDGSHHFTRHGTARCQRAAGHEAQCPHLGRAEDGTLCEWPALVAQPVAADTGEETPS